MNDLSCHTAQLWLQEPDSLHPIDARHLDRHLSTCEHCATYRQQQVEMDRFLSHGLGTAAARAGSVRSAVRSQILGSMPTHAVGNRHVPRRSSSAHRILSPATPTVRRTGNPLGWLKPAIAAVPVAIIAMLGALFLPQMLQRNGAVTPAGAAWHVQRPRIAFPVTVDRNHPSHLLAGAYGQVYQSWNAGTTWSHLGAMPDGLVVRAEVIDAANPLHYL